MKLAVFHFTANQVAQNHRHTYRAYNVAFLFQNSRISREKHEHSRYSRENKNDEFRIKICDIVNAKFPDHLYGNRFVNLI